MNGVQRVSSRTKSIRVSRLCGGEHTALDVLSVYRRHSRSRSALRFSRTPSLVLRLNFPGQRVERRPRSRGKADRSLARRDGAIVRTPKETTFLLSFSLSVSLFRAYNCRKTLYAELDERFAELSHHPRTIRPS